MITFYRMKCVCLYRYIQVVAKASLLLAVIILASGSLAVLDCNTINFVLHNPSKHGFYADWLISGVGNLGCGVDTDCTSYVSYNLKGKNVPVKCVCGAALHNNSAKRIPPTGKPFAINGKCCYYDSQYSKTILLPFKDDIYDIYAKPCVASPACTVDADCKNYKFKGPYKPLDHNKAAKSIRTTNNYCFPGQCCALF